ncbi:YslB family protein [Metabacillus sp. HB246100]|uniref:YslB family protein n=1 Tax=Bacillus weihaiensis TaxID=1547283 RepID=UPI0023549552|nr:YslB family protein [Bacillus weihaiensis]
MKQTERISKEDLAERQIPAFGYELLREVLLPDVLGQDYANMLYWAGKSLARKFPVTSIEEISEFFHAAGWGDLVLSHDKKNEMEFELTSELISIRFKHENGHTYQMEAGFIAEQLQMMNQHITETYEQLKKRSNKVVFTVKWDSKDAIEELSYGKRSDRKK